MSDFNLSEKRDEFDPTGIKRGLYWEKDVKRFIKELKRNFCADNHFARDVNEEIINELAGEKLI